MKHWFAACVLGVVVSLPGAERGAGSGPVESTAAAPAEHRAVLDRYCVTCHNDRLSGKSDRDRRDQHSAERTRDSRAGGVGRAAGTRSGRRGLHRDTLDRVSLGGKHPGEQGRRERVAASAVEGRYRCAEARLIRNGPSVAGCGRCFGTFDSLPYVRCWARGFEESDEMRRTAAPVVLSHGLWVRRFGGDPAAVGRTVVVGNRGHIVVGVAPRGFRGIESAAIDAWILLAVSPELCSFPGTNLLEAADAVWLRTIGRVRDGFRSAPRRPRSLRWRRAWARTWERPMQDGGVAAWCPPLDPGAPGRWMGG